ncbi:hypothetical protein GYH30_022689 [Glycine max]|uniref:Uncharacterized protein n=1 Tax=Glycine max TaxID=3847 RepID=K7L9H7_SOYBN|nr:hypothetical protein GYH30_022689 [Glycine max]
MHPPFHTSKTNHGLESNPKRTGPTLKHITNQSEQVGKFLRCLMKIKTTASSINKELHDIFSRWRDSNCNNIKNKKQFNHLGGSDQNEKPFSH